MRYYKVVDKLSSEVTIDTAKVNYGLTLSNTAIYSQFLNLVTNFSAKYNTPLDFICSVNNNLFSFGDFYLKNLPEPTGSQFDLFSLTQNANHQGYYISENGLIEIVENLVGIGLDWFDEGYYLWESIFEKVRVTEFQSRLSRVKSFFLFDNLVDCHNYIKNVKYGGVVVQVNIISGGVPFKADMNLLDSIPNHLTFKDAENVAKEYWAGSSSASPIYEYLFQGVCNMSPI